MRVSLFALLLLAGPSLAAPVPPPPKPAELTREGMVGQWSYSYGSMEDGTLWLWEDGRYTAKHSPNAQTYYVGFWWVDGGTLHLREWSSNPGGCATDYRVEFDARDYPFLDGTAGSVKVSLRR